VETDAVSQIIAGRRWEIEQLLELDEALTDRTKYLLAVVVREA
jgi:hypothetical protein